MIFEKDLMLSKEGKEYVILKGIEFESPEELFCPCIEIPSDIKKIFISKTYDHVKKLIFSGEIDFEFELYYNKRQLELHFPNLEEVEIKTEKYNSFNTGMIFSADKTKLVFVPPMYPIENLKIHNVKSIETYSIYKNGRIRTIELPSTLTEIQNSAITHNCFLKKITLPEKHVELKKYSFECNSELEEVKNSEYIKSIKDFKGGFFNCKNLRYIDLRGLEEAILPDDCFSDSGIKSIDINTSKSWVVGCRCFSGSCLENFPFEILVAEKIGNHAFSNTFIKTVSGHFLLSVGCFSNCRSLTTVDIYNDNVDIPEIVFMNCPSLQRVHFHNNERIPKLYHNIGVRAFKNCVSLESVGYSYFPRYMEIKNEAFYSCRNLELFYADVQTGIGEEAFRDCTNLKSVRLSTEKELLVQKNAFWNCKKLEEFYCTGKILLLNKVFNHCKNLKRFECKSFNLEYNPEKCFQDCPSIEDFIFEIVPTKKSLENISCIGNTKIENLIFRRIENILFG